MRCNGCGYESPQDFAFCPNCGQAGSTSTASGSKYCPSCGAAQAVANSVCSSCGQPFPGTASAPSQPPVGYQPTGYQPGNGGGRKGGMWKAIVAAVLVLLVGVGAFAAFSLKVFASPKEILKYQIEKAEVPASDAPATVTMSFKMTNLKGDVPGLDELNNVPISLAISVDPAAKRMQMHFEMDQKGDKTTGDLWIDGEGKLILGLSELQPFIEDSLGALPQDIPQYLTLDDQAMGREFESMWDEIDQGGSADITDSQRQLAVKLIDAIPDEYFAREGLTSVSFSFDHDDLAPLTKAVIQYMFDNKNDIADLIKQVVEEADDAAAAEGFEDFLAGLDSVTQADLDEVIEEMEQELKSQMPFELGQTTLTLSKPLFGDASFALKGSIRFTGMDTPFTGTLEYSFEASSKKNLSIEIPATTSSNSQSLERFLRELGLQ